MSNFSGTTPCRNGEPAYHAHEIRSREHQASAVAFVVHVESLDLVGVEVSAQIAESVASPRVRDYSALASDGDGSYSETYEHRYEGRLKGGTYSAQSHR